MNYGLIGKTLDHSFSKRYFDEFFSREGLPHTYELIEIPSIYCLGDEIERRQLAGFNITIPYKEQILPMLDATSHEAHRIGAVNVAKRQGKQLIGFNTDAPAFRATLLPLLKPHHTDALILGTGGASKAVAYALTELGISHTLVSRSPKDGQIGYAEAYERAHSTFLIVNCTPVGTTPNDTQSPWLRPEVIGHKHLCYDLIYNPSPTAFLSEAGKRGAATQGGLEMLHLQAALSWKIWQEE